MRLPLLTLLLPIAIAFGFSSAQTWLASFQQPLRNIIDNPLRQSTVPQFLLDSGHPWILAHQPQLERLPNAEAFLCTGLVDNRAELEIPPDLFDRLEVNNNRYGISRPGWPNALERFTEISKCPRALEQVQELEIYIYVHESPYSELANRLLEPSLPSSQLISLLGDALESMNSLKYLKYHISKEHTHLFGKEFRGRKLTLPSVKHLEPGPWSHYLVRMCPNLKTITSGSEWYNGHLPDNPGHRFQWGFELIQSTASTPKLKRFSMEGRHDDWSPELVSEVVRVMPQIESLGLYCLFKNEVYDHELHWEDSKLKATLEKLNELQNLTNLDLPESSRLGLGFDGGPQCGNAYFGKKGRKYLRQVIREDAEATDTAGDIVVRNVPQLVTFRIGAQCPDITRGSDGKHIVSCTWPWTGRMDEWLMEEVPETLDGFD